MRKTTKTMTTNIEGVGMQLVEQDLLNGPSVAL